MPEPATDVTRFLAEVRRGDRSSEGRLLELVYTELHKLASALMRRERVGHTLQASALVNEAYMRLVGNADCESRAHFYMTAAQVMRRILIDHARKKSAGKRLGGVRVELQDAMAVSTEDAAKMVDLDAALNRLQALDARQAKIVELRFFGGMTVEETAEALGISTKTVKRDWAMARAWLEGELREAV